MGTASALRANFIGRKTKNNRLPASAMATYRQALSAFVLSRHALWVPAARRSGRATTTHVWARRAHCGAYEVVPGKKLIIRGPAGELPPDRIKICGKRKNGPPGVGARPKTAHSQVEWVR